MNKRENISGIKKVPGLAKPRCSKDLSRFDQQFISTILDIVEALIVVLDKKGRIIYFNQACEEATGYHFDEVKGRIVFDVFLLPEEAKAVKSIFHQLKAGDFPNSFRNHWKTKNGQNKFIAWRNTTLTDEEGAVQLIIGTGIDITERVKAEEALQQREERYKSIINGAAEGFWLIGPDLRTLEVNDSLCKMLGYSREEMLGKSPFDFVDEENLKIFKEQTAKISSSPHRHYNIVLKAKSGIDVHTRFNATTVRDKQGNVINAFAFVTDITDLMLTKNALLESKERMEQLYRVIPSAIFTVNTERIVTSFNNKAEEITGYSAEEVIGKKCTTFALDPCSRGCGLFMCDITEPIIGKTCTIRKKSEEMRLATKNVDLLRDLDGNVVGAVESFEDITERKKAEEKIEYMAYYDPLTSLPNRALLNDRLSLALAQANRSQEMLAVLFLDLDNFKAINDTLGHACGDFLLQSVAERLKHCLREGDTISRLGGDEFVLLLPQIQHVDDAVKVARKVLEAINPPFIFGKSDLHVTTSVGISIYPNDGTDSQTLLKNADTALYRAKELGRNNYQLYTPSMNAKVFERLMLESNLRRAIEQDEFEVYYQPQVDLSSGKIIGIEALLRWKHTGLGLMYPGSFIPIAEETGLIVPIGEWVLKAACEQNKAWQDAGHEPICMTVNLSPRQLHQEDIFKKIKGLLKETGLKPSHLGLEITESAIMKDADIAISTLLRLKKLGIKILIDDFGIGHSSLSCLKNLPVDTLKIDRSFICDMVTSRDDRAIVTAIITLARSLKLKAIAEGVETKGQVEVLRSLGCDAIQGYIISQPSPAEDCVKLLAANRRLCA